MDLACGAASRCLYLPLRAVFLRCCGQARVEMMENMALVASTASSSRASGLNWPSESRTSRRSRSAWSLRTVTTGMEDSLVISRSAPSLLAPVTLEVSSV